MDKVLAQVRAFLRGLSINQKVMLAGSLVVVALVVFVFVRLFAAADFASLFTGLDPTDTQKIIQQLAAENIAYQLSTDGTSISVPADKLDRVRVELASQSLPHTGRMGFELFDKPNWSSSDFSEQVNYQRAVEAELERTIETMDAVESARVHLVAPHESLFTSEERPAKAAVVVKLRTERGADQTVLAISNLVASAWENLSPDAVTIVSADGHLPLSGGKPDGNGKALSDLETVMAERIVDTLSPVVGAEHVRSSVTIEYNPDSGERTEEQYDPNAVALLSSQITEDQTTGTAPAGIPGTPSNVPSAQSGAAQVKPADIAQGMRSESKTFAVSKTIHHTIEPAGQIRHLAAAVLVDDAMEVSETGGKRQETRRKRTPDEMKQLEDLARAAVGFDTKRGDELAIRNISFEVPPVEVPATPSAVQRTLRTIQPWTGLLRYAGMGLVFLLVYLLVLRPMTRQVIATVKALPAPGSQAALPATAGREGRPKPHMTAADLEKELAQELSDASSEVTRAVALKRHLVDKVKREPEGATRLIQNWVRDEGDEEQA